MQKIVCAFYTYLSLCDVAYTTRTTAAATSDVESAVQTFFYLLWFRIRWQLVKLKKLEAPQVVSHFSHFRKGNGFAHAQLQEESVFSGIKILTGSLVLYKTQSIIQIYCKWIYLARQKKRFMLTVVYTISAWSYLMIMIIPYNMLGYPFPVPLLSMTGQSTKREKCSSC